MNEKNRNKKRSKYASKRHKLDENKKKVLPRENKSKKEKLIVRVAISKMASSKILHFTNEFFSFNHEILFFVLKDKNKID